MRMIDIIQKKKVGSSLTKDEIDFVIHTYCEGETPDYQMSAFLMAVYFNGMNDEEISHLTMAMANSGDTIDLSQINGLKVDKHSTGGVGDKISLIVAPIVASLGVPVAKMSGRGLGHTGGTIDKLESIPGFNIQLTNEQFVEAVNRIKIALVGQTGNLAPADKKIYALRDVTATVDSLPLIASSIMSKKIASGADAIVLDVKVGSGAFMKTIEDAQKLASTMVRIGNSLNRKTIAVISGMNQPLGRETGNANEIKESIEVLMGKGERDLVEVSLEIAAYMVMLGGAFETYEEAYRATQEVIASGKAIEVFKQFITSQGGDEAIVENPDLLPSAAFSYDLKSIGNGYVASIDAEKIGVAAMLLGAGRAKKEDRIDYSVGISLHKKIGDPIEKDEVFCTIHTNKENNDNVMKLIHEAYKFGTEQPVQQPIIYGVIS